MRLAILAITGPIPGPQQQVRDVAQAGAAFSRIDRMQGGKSAYQALAPQRRHFAEAERLDRIELDRETRIVRDAEVECDCAFRYGARDDIDAKQPTRCVNSDMLNALAVYDTDAHRGRVEQG
nr:hypothetical protein [Sphingobium sp. CAP-1]